MANFRGMDGSLILGGILQVTAGNVLLNGAKTVGQTSLNLDGTGLQGVLIAGDTFTIAGESGAPVHTVNGGPYVAAGAAINGITFTPGIAAGGAADNAVITFTANNMTETRQESFDPELEALNDTVQGDKHETNVGGVARWSGSADALLDYGDAKQKALIDMIATASPTGTITGVMIGIGLNKQFYGAAVLSGFSIRSQMGALVTISFKFTGSGPLLPNWN